MHVYFRGTKIFGGGGLYGRPGRRTCCLCLDRDNEENALTASFQSLSSSFSIIKALSPSTSRSTHRPHRHPHAHYTRTRHNEVRPFRPRPRRRRLSTGQCIVDSQPSVCANPVHSLTAPQTLQKASSSPLTSPLPALPSFPSSTLTPPFHPASPRSSTLLPPSPPPPSPPITSQRTLSTTLWRLSARAKADVMTLLFENGLASSTRNVSPS